jgi:hypothetical protein
MSIQYPEIFRTFIRNGLHKVGSTWLTEEQLMTPMVSWNVMNAIANSTSRPIQEAFPMVGLIGSEVHDISDETSIPMVDPVFLNVNSPWSIFICGSQGSGKSHTLSCILESCLLSERRLGQLPTPLSGLVFHYDKIQGDTVAEASYLSSHIKTRVLVSPSNYLKMQELYESRFEENDNLKVEAFYLLSKHLNTERILRLMAVGQRGDQMPLYMQVCAL